MKKLALILLLLIITCIGFADTKKLYFMQGSSNQYRTVGPGFAPVARVVAESQSVGIVCPIATCAFFDGVDDWGSVLTNANIPAGQTAITLMWWMQDLATTTTDERWMVYIGSRYNPAWGFGFNATSTLVNPINTGNIGPGGLWPHWTQWDGPRSDQWTHYAFSIPASSNVASGTFYRNGVPMGYLSSLDNRVFDRAADEWYIGGHYYNGYLKKMKMKFAEFAVFNSALTQVKIQEYAAIKLTGSESGLRLLYHCDEGSGTAFLDSSGYGNKMTLYNGVSWSTK